MSVVRSRIIGCGSYLPERVVSNAELAETVDTSDEWIRQRTGIRQRHIVAEGELTSDLALKASREALADAGIEADSIDLIVLATTTPDDTFPATAVRVQAGLGITHGAAFDVQAVCSGFIYALSVADAMVKGGSARRALVIGAESFTRILDWEDRTTCVLFGDGAGAVVLERQEGGGSAEDKGILTTHLHSDGRYRDILFVDGGVGTTGTVGHVRMNGQEVFKHAVRNLASVVEESLSAAGLTADDLDWLVPHQANRRIIEATAKKLRMSMDQVVLTVEDHANTSAASVPLALTAGKNANRFQDGDLILLEAMGGGLTWGAALVRW